MHAIRIGLALAAMAGLAIAQSSNTTSFFPGSYVRIIEDTGSSRIILYDGSDPDPSRSHVLEMDADSKITIELLKERLEEDVTVNQVFMRAELTRADAKTNPSPVEVLGYSEIPKEPGRGFNAAGTTVRSANQLKAVLFNMYNVSKEITRRMYGDGAPCLETGECDFTAAKDNDTVRRVFRGFQPEIDTIAAYFADDGNRALAMLVAQEVFDMGADSLLQVARQYPQDVAGYLDATEDAARTNRFRVLALRTAAVWGPLRKLRRQALQGHSGDTEELFRQEWDKKVKVHFRKFLVPGFIDLPQYGPKDGDTLRIRVDARSPGGQTLIAPFVVNIAVKHLKARLSTAMTAFYLHRRDVKTSDLTTAKRVNFAPAPGLTFGLTLFHRGTKADSRNNGYLRYNPNRLMRALAPGVGINASFMNFDNASDFDPTAKDPQGNVVGAFRTTQGSSVQLGVGPAVSFFNNAIQFTFGANLQVNRKRTYWGIGIGFIQVGKEIARYVK